MSNLAFVELMTTATEVNGKSRRQLLAILALHTGRPHIDP